MWCRQRQSRDPFLIWKRFHCRPFPAGRDELENHEDYWNPQANREIPGLINATGVQVPYIDNARNGAYIAFFEQNWRRTLPAAKTSAKVLGTGYDPFLAMPTWKLRWALHINALHRKSDSYEKVDASSNIKLRVIWRRVMELALHLQKVINIGKEMLTREWHQLWPIVA